MKLAFTAPIRIESELNRRDHWRAVKRRRDAQKSAIYWSYREAIGSSGTLFVKKRHFRRPLTVTLTRIAPRPITDEHDNLRSGWKGVVDMLAEQIDPLTDDEVTRFGRQINSPLIKRFLATFAALRQENERLKEALRERCANPQCDGRHVTSADWTPNGPGHVPMRPPEVP